ncbi:rod-binding protein [Microvirga rosea]|uniref:rod-binding protein n=1 Tax=Microvirga rosea TaxID=2715425 RepID=UPI001D09BBEE|nr:rod-binding protein [Microvirga rosea]MCB8823464.1 rod-binding protein [Microvirga rosea]
MMGINPPSDIVQDVARAADPVKLQAASRKLIDISNGADATDFAEVLKTLPNSSASAMKDPYAFGMASRNHTTLASSGKTGSPYQQFEAFVLQSFIESMLPKDADATFGKGTAGGVWRSMLAEQIGAQVAKAGGIGIASKLLAGKVADKGNSPLKSSVPISGPNET